MALTDLSDSDTLELADPLIEDIINGSNSKDWSLFSKHQTTQSANDPENRANVEQQWEEHAFLTSLSIEREYLGVLRRDGRVIIAWKQKSTEVPGDFLATMYLEEIDGAVKETAFWLK